MDSFEYFKCQEYFNGKERVYALSLVIPAASIVWSLFDKKTVSDITEAFEKDLLKRFDTFFQGGQFIFLYDLGDDDDLADEIVDTVHAFYEHRKKRKILGTWKYSRKDRQVTLIWSVPDWFEDRGGKRYIEEEQPLTDICGDWYTNSF